MTDEQRDLDNLTKHPGWLILVQEGKKDVEGRVQTAMRNAAGEQDDVKALNKLRQCIAAKEAIESLIGWPEMRLRNLRASEAATNTTPQLSRRGNL